MITQFCSLCRLSSSVIVNVQRYASRGKKPYVSEKKKNIQRSIEKLRLRQKTKENEGKIPIITAKRSLFNFHVGDTFNKFAPVLITQGWNNPKSKMDYFVIQPTIDKFQDETDTTPFKDLNFSPIFVENLSNLGMEVPSEIQSLAFPKLMDGNNTIIAAETGSGKTLAYLLPVVQQVYQRKISEQDGERSLNHPLGLIITPSRELANQIHREAKKLTKGTKIKTKLIIGGRVKRMMRNPPVGQVDIIIATLGAMSKLVTNHVYKLKHLQHVILDEADSLFDVTFHEKLLPFLDKIRFQSESNKNGAQLILCSATMPAHMSTILSGLIDTNTLVTATTKKLHSVNVTQKFIRVGPSQKPMLLLELIKKKAVKKEPLIIFANKADTCMWLHSFLKQFNVKSVSLNAHMLRSERQNIFDKFNNGEVNVLCTTDAGSRGLNTIHVKEVINYDFPLQTAEYIHRCGRTGRIGSPKNCQVINFISRPLEIVLARKIEIATKKGVPIPIVDMFRQDFPEQDSLLQQIKIESERDDAIIDEEIIDESDESQYSTDKDETEEANIPY